MVLADLEDEPPYQPGFMLADEVDPDALDDLVTDEINEVMVAFTMDDYLIVVQSNGRVQIQTIED